MIINNTPNYLLLGVDYVVTNDTSTEKRVFNPFVNDNRIEKNDFTIKLENIRKTYSHEFEIPALTWDMPFEFERIDVLTIKAECEVDYVQPDFSIKLESSTNPAIDIREYITIPFSNGIRKFYISNPLQYKLFVKIVYLMTGYKNSKINSRLYKKEDNLLYWNIKHNLGVKPVFFFLNEAGEKVIPDYTILSEDKNELRLNFDEVFNGYIVLDHYTTHDQLDNSKTWTKEHDLDKYPSILVFNGADQQETDFEVSYITSNTISLTFPAAIKGKALLY